MRTSRLRTSLDISSLAGADTFGESIGIATDALIMRRGRLVTSRYKRHA
jgi:hypothetical protein